MSIKSILLSVLSIVIFVGIIVLEVFLFRSQFILGFVGLLLIGIPIKLNRKALDESSGLFDKILAKYICPVLALIGIIFVILLFTLWM